MRNQTKDIVYGMTVNPKISIRVFKTIVRTMKKSKTLREELNDHNVWDESVMLDWLGQTQESQKQRKNSIKDYLKLNMKQERHWRDYE